MEKVYWLSRKRASLEAARNATSSEARLIHYDLAGRYSLKATSAKTHFTDLANLCLRRSRLGCLDPYSLGFSLSNRLGVCSE